MKTNKPGKQNPLFLYVDKIVFVVLILAAVYYCYSAVSLPQITWTPEQLNNDATQAQQTIEKSEYREELVPVNYDERALDIRAGIPARYYQTAERWEAPVFREKIMRSIPETFTVLKLRAIDGVGGVMIREEQSVLGGNQTGGGMGDMGAFGGMTGGGMTGGGMSGGGMTGGMSSGSKVETKHWILLTGLIPYEDQLREYVDKYANALHSSAMDYPDYLFLKIQRNEIGKNDENGEPIWEDVDVVQQLADAEQWAGIGNDPVDYQYTLPPPSPYFPPMAAYIPPLANRQFGYEVAYPPYIPLLSDSLAEQQRKQLESIEKLRENQKVMTPDEIFDPESGIMTPFIQGSGAGSGGMSGGGLMGGMSGGTTGGGTSRISNMYQGGNTSGGMSGGMSGRTGMGMSGGMSMSGSDMSMSGGMGMSSGMSMSGGMGNTTSRWTTIMETPPSVYIDAPYRLFRYFDFSIEPGKSYQYRVSLGLRNPNYMLNDRFLTEDAAKFKEQPLVWTDYSLPSGAVAVYSNARVLAQSVTTVAANRPWLQQGATIASLVYDTSDKVDYLAKDKTATPGTVLNFLRTQSQLANTQTSTSGMSGGSPGGIDTSGGSTTGRTPATTTKTAKTLDHISGECLLDVVGKRKLIGTNAEHTPAGQIMVMGFDGTLKLQTVKEDKLELDRYEKKETASSMYGGMSP